MHQKWFNEFSFGHFKIPSDNSQIISFLPIFASWCLLFMPSTPKIVTANTPNSAGIRQRSHCPNPIMAVRITFSES